MLCFNWFTVSGLRVYCFICFVTSSNAQEWQQANLLTLHYSLVSVLVLLAPGTIKSSHAWTWVWLLLAQTGQSIRAGKTHKGVVCGVTSTHCCKSSSSWVFFLVIFVLQGSVCAILYHCKSIFCGSFWCSALFLERIICIFLFLQKILLSI